MLHFIFFSLDSRTDLPKVRYATALDWFLLMSFLYCIATLLEFAGVHYFTKVRVRRVTTVVLSPNGNSILLILHFDKTPRDYLL